MDRRLIVKLPVHPYGELAKMVNAQTPGAKASTHSLRWHSNEMRKKGLEGTRRVKGGRERSWGGRGDRSVGAVEDTYE